MPRTIIDLWRSREPRFRVGDSGGGQRSFEFFNGFLGRLLWNPTANRDISVPDAAGTLVLDTSLGKVDTFTASGTWTKPAGAKLVEVILIGPGGSGGGGRKGAAASARCGGGSGSSGCYARIIYAASYLGATETVTIGAQSIPGVGSTTDATNGTAATNAGATMFGTGGKLLIAPGGGGGGGGGSGVSGSAGPVRNNYPGPAHIAGVTSSNTGGAGTIGAAGQLQSSGGSGGGITTANVANTGGGVNSVGGTTQAGPFWSTAIAATAVGTNGANGANAPTESWLVGMAGAGGGAALTGVAGNGGAGGFPGGAGGGGGAGTDGVGNRSGDGGQGGAGFAVIITHF